MSSRTPNWKSPDDTPEEDHLFDVIEPLFSSIVYCGGLHYTSDDFKKGVDTQQLRKYSSTLKALVTLDKRGGHFGQIHMQRAIGKCTAMDEYKDAFEGWRLRLGIESYEKGVIGWAYKLRVMLAHIRTKCAAWRDKANSTEPTELVEIYKVFTDVPQISPQKRECPFVSFRAASDQKLDNPEDADEDSIEVQRVVVFEGDRCRGKRTFSDGSAEYATSYVKADGFINCHWDDGAVLRTEVASQYLAPDGTHIVRPEAPKVLKAVCKS
eukprot:340261-Pyramimonas_sp.AAC.1